MSRLYIVSYDVADARRRNRVARALESFGSRVQQSVFECWLEEADLGALKRRIEPLIDSNADHVRYYPLCPKDVPRVVLDGKATLSTDPDYHVI
jgi:CRISPR-associated protein Cas2